MEREGSSHVYGLQVIVSKMVLTHHFLAYRWRNNGNSEGFIFLGSKISADGDYSHEIKRRLLLGRKAMINLDSILKSKTLLCQQRSI